MSIKEFGLFVLNSMAPIKYRIMVNIFPIFDPQNCLFGFVILQYICYSSGSHTFLFGDLF